MARSATRRNKCSACASLLIDQEAEPLKVRMENDGHQTESVFHTFTALLDRGRLLVPSPIAVYLTMRICHIWRQLLMEEASRRRLLTCNQPRRAFVDVTRIVASQDPE